MIRLKTLAILAGLALAAAALALWLTAERAAVSERTTDQPLVPGLLASINDVSGIAVFDAETGDEATLRQQDGRWGVVERDGYPAQLPELRKALLTLAEARLIEAKTRDPAFHERLGVEDPSADGATSRKLTVERPGAEPVVVIAGDTGFRGETTTYVRRADEDQSWVATGNLALEADPVFWLDKAVIDVPTGIVRRVVIEHPDGDRVEIAKAERDQPNFDLVNLPPDRELLAPATPNSIAGALGSLRLDDVLPLAAFDAADQAPVVTTFETFDGRRVTARSWVLDDARYVALDVAYDPSLATADAPAGEAAEVDEAAVDGDAVANPAGGGDEARASIEADAVRVSGWVYEIPSYKHSNLTKRLDDLLKPVEDATETGADGS